MFYRGTGGGDWWDETLSEAKGAVNSVTKLIVVTHQSPSPLCEVDKGRLADLPRSAGVGYETTRSEDSTTGYDRRGGEKTLKNVHLAIYTASANVSQMQCTVFLILYKLSQIEITQLQVLKVLSLTIDRIYGLTTGIDIVSNRG